MSEYGIPAYDANVLVGDKKLANYFEEICKGFKDAKLVSNWIMTELLRRMNLEEVTLEELKLSIEDLIVLFTQLSESKISNGSAKKVFREMFEEGKKPLDIIDEKGMAQISDDSFIEGLVNEVLGEHPEAIDDIKNGKDRAIGFLVGQVMKKSKGKANPQMVSELIKKNAK